MTQSKKNALLCFYFINFSYDRTIVWRNKKVVVKELKRVMLVQEDQIYQNNQ